MKNVLIVSGHTNLAASVANRTILDTLHARLPEAEIVDEMLSILCDRNRIMQKKEMEATNARWNEMTWNRPLFDEEGDRS